MSKLLAKLAVAGDPDFVEYGARADESLYYLPREVGTTPVLPPFFPEPAQAGYWARRSQNARNDMQELAEKLEQTEDQLAANAIEANIQAATARAADRAAHTAATAANLGKMFDRLMHLAKEERPVPHEESALSGMVEEIRRIVGVVGSSKISSDDPSVSLPEESAAAPSDEHEKVLQLPLNFNRMIRQSDITRQPAIESVQTQLEKQILIPLQEQASRIRDFYGTVWNRHIEALTNFSPQLQETKFNIVGEGGGDDEHETFGEHDETMGEHGETKEEIDRISSWPFNDGKHVQQEPRTEENTEKQAEQEPLVLVEDFVKDRAIEDPLANPRLAHLVGATKINPQRILHAEPILSINRMEPSSAPTNATSNHAHQTHEFEQEKDMRAWFPEEEMLKRREKEEDYIEDWRERHFGDEWQDWMVNNKGFADSKVAKEIRERRYGGLSPKEQYRKDRELIFEELEALR